MKYQVVILGLCTLSAGCRFAHDVTRAVIVKPFHFAEYVEERREERRHRLLAAAMWETLRSQDPQPAVSGDYAEGFSDGFVDFMMAGGAGLPPAYPPKKYWKAKYQTVEGHRAIQDWFEGFRAGAAVARDSGCRRLVTIPMSALIATPTHPHHLDGPLCLEHASVTAGDAPVRPRQPPEAAGSELEPLPGPDEPMPTPAEKPPVPAVSDDLMQSAWIRSSCDYRSDEGAGNHSEQARRIGTKALPAEARSLPPLRILEGDSVLRRLPKVVGG